MRHQPRHVLGAVTQTVFGRLGQREGVRLHLVRVVADRRDNELDILRGQPGPRAFGQHQLGAVGEERGRPALVHLDMGFAMAHDAPVRRHQRCQR